MGAKTKLNKVAPLWGAPDRESALRRVQTKRERLLFSEALLKQIPLAEPRRAVCAGTVAPLSEDTEPLEHIGKLVAALQRPARGMLGFNLCQRP